MPDAEVMVPEGIELTAPDLEPDPVCGRCYFYAESSSACHRYAPRSSRDFWPHVQIDDWCGEFVENP